MTDQRPHEMGDDHLLIDVDSKIPNLALMKISRHIREQGGHVKLACLHGKYRLLPPGPFKTVWISCIFTWNKSLALMIQSWAKAGGSNVEIGGSGISLLVQLPSHITTASATIVTNALRNSSKRQNCLKKYTCKVDGFKIESPNDQDMWDHIDKYHADRPPRTFWKEQVKIEIGFGLGQ